jgi:hypothetical protein
MLTNIQLALDFPLVHPHLVLDLSLSLMIT